MTTASDTDNPFENVRNIAGRTAMTGNGVVLPDSENEQQIASDPSSDPLPLPDEETSGETESDGKDGDEDDTPELESGGFVFPSVEDDWAYDFIEFEGHKLGVRIPTQQALTGFTMATGAYIPPAIQQATVSMFVHQHFSPVSYAFLTMKLINPDTEFTEETFSDIVKMLVERAGEKIVAETKAKAAAEKKARRPRKR